MQGKKQVRLIAFFLILSIGLSFIKTTVFAKEKFLTVSGNSVSMPQLNSEKSDLADDTPPYVISLSRSVSENYFVNDRALSIHYRIEADDNVGLDELPYSYDEGKSWTKSNEFIVTKNGEVLVLIKDSSGNICDYEFEEYRIDNKPPHIKEITYIFEEESNGYGNCAELVIEAEDEGGAGLDSQYIAFFENAYTSKNKRSVNVNGEYSVWLKDGLGNVSKETVSVNNIDITPPVIKNAYAQMSVSVNGYYSDAKLCIDAYDEEAGLDSEAFSFDGGVSFEHYNQKIVHKNGTYRVVVKDVFGHYAYETITVSGIDECSPVIDDISLVLKNPSMGYGSEGELVVKAHDDESGLGIMAYSFDGGNCYGTTNSIKISENGIINVCVMDNAGNISATSINVTQIDTICPNLLISGNPTVITKDDVTLKITAADTQSGIASLWYENTSNRKKICLKEVNGEKSVSDSLDISKNGTYIFYAYDNAGNETTSTVKITKIDKSYKSSSSTAPGIRKEIINPAKNTTTTTAHSFKAEEDLGDLATKSSSVIKKSIALSEEEADYIGINEEEAIEPEFVPATLNILSDDGKIYSENLNEEVIVNSEEENLSEGGKKELNIIYPETEEKDDKGTVIAITILVSLFLLSLLCFVLYKTGLLNKDGFAKKFRREEK